MSLPTVYADQLRATGLVVAIPDIGQTTGPDPSRNGPVGCRLTQMSDTLTWSQSLQIECLDILQLLRKRWSGESWFVEGFVVIRSRSPLDVEAVYSFKNVEIR